MLRLGISFRSAPAVELVSIYLEYPLLRTALL